MKNLIRFSVVGAMFAAAGVVHAQAQPSSGSADLWLFVSDQSAGTTFAEDTGVSIGSVLNSSDYQSGATLASVTDSFSVSASSALSSYITAANTAGQSLTYAVEGIQYAGSTSNGVAKVTGNDIGIASSNASGAGSGYAGMELANLESWSGGLNNDVTYLDGTYVAGGASYAFSSGSILGNVWGASSGGLGGSTTEYANGPDEAGVSIGTSTTLYAVTGNGNTGQVQSYILGDAAGDAELTLAANGTLSLNPSTVPLPPAVWLLGSGLLGLAGVGRRRLSV
jgi:hypothetical protein